MSAHLLLPLLLCAGDGAAARDDAGAGELAESYVAETRPLLLQYCSKCHSDRRTEGEVNLAAFQSFAAVRRDVATWQKVGEMLESVQMPPPAERQPSDDERARLSDWVRRMLKAEARRFAGDPGPVVLRRLSNAEYTYAIGDLTGVDSLRPALEFPVDGAAGEGFTNAGAALVMSPALLVKYLDAAKEVAAHAVLTPAGIRFSSRKSRRDWTDEILAEIRGLYAQFTDAKGGSQVDLQGIVFDTNGGGRLPIERYFLALLASRDALERGAASIEAVARDRQLSAKYLGSLWKLLSPEPGSPPAQPSLLPAQPSLLIDELRQRWQRVTKPEEDAAALAAEVARWQQALWRFTSVGHIGKAGGPSAWMEPVNPIAARQELKLALPAAESKELVLYLVVGDAGDGNAHDFVVWERPRFTAPGRPELLLRDLRRVTAELSVRREQMIKSAAKCLAAAAEAGAAEGAVEVAALAQRHGVDPDALTAWMEAVGVANGGPAPIGAPLTRSLASFSGYDFIQGWVGDDALTVVANSSDQHVRIPGNMAPHSVAVHPTPTLQVAVAWRSPISAPIRIEGVVQHAHPECGNGVEWAVELRRGGTRQRLASGSAQGPERVVVGPLENVRVRTGDLIALVIGPRGGDHSCDLTAIELALGDGAEEWSLARDVSSDLLVGNPHPDLQGRKGVWNFFSEPVAAADQGVVPAGSILARWQSAASPEEAQRLAEELQRLLEGGFAALPKEAPDALLARQLTSLGGPLLSTALRTVTSLPLPAAPAGPTDAVDAGFSLDAARFGMLPDGTAIDPASLCVKAPAVIEIRLPAELMAGAELSSAAFLHPAAGAEGSVQLQLLTEKPAFDVGLQPTAATPIAADGPWTSSAQGVAYAAPVVVNEGSAARRRFESAFDDFRRWFPAAACYVKIVPVDEVVTLTLFHREDEPLRRLLLSDESAAHLDRLWDELHFVSLDALTLVDAFEQIWQYATQDADPKVFEPLRQPILDRAAAFRRTLVEAEPRHLDAVLELASLAFRRPLTEPEAHGLRDLYRALRQEELPHDEAIRLVIARVLVSPAFLYRPERSAALARVEAPAPENPELAPEAEPLPPDAAPVSGYELATRLSFFLWSSIPDAPLRAAAADGSLRDPDVLLAQTHRMVADARVRRLATEFATQWLHVYQFDEHDEKSPAAFPTFAGLRGDMYEEPIRFFTDLFQRDGSLLEVLDADHTFLDGTLAEHYGIAGVSGPEWRRVDGVRQQGRGGILGMAATLAKQSGASRTSPILRGAWVCEVLLGEKLPKPPKGVPQLPDVVPEGLTERQMIEQHTSQPTCARCHERIDPIGFSLEGFDAIGRARTGALAQAGSDTQALLQDGTEIDGLDGLRSYLLTTRRDAWTRQFCKKLLGYALGRGVQLSDEPLLDEMQARLQADGHRVQTAVEAIVTSRQFQCVRTGSAIR